MQSSKKSFLEAFFTKSSILLLKLRIRKNPIFSFLRKGFLTFLPFFYFIRGFKGYKYKSKPLQMPEGAYKSSYKYKSKICKEICTCAGSAPSPKRGQGKDLHGTKICKKIYTSTKKSSPLQAKLRQNVKWSSLFTWIYFLAFLIIPICALIAKAFSLTPDGLNLAEASSTPFLGTGNKNRFMDFITIATQPIALSAYSVTFSMAAIASLFNAFFGFILAWVLVRYNFPFKRFLDAAIDLPFAVPTSVAGLTLATVYSPQGWIGEGLQKLGIQVVYTRLGIATAMVFVSLPFVVRSLQPVLQEIDEQIEEAALSLGASPYTTFRKVLFPPLLPAFLTGVTLGFSRAIGEYGSLVLVSSNIPYKDLIASVLIFQNLESYSLGEATVIAKIGRAHV